MSTAISHHPDGSTLASYAAGTLAEPLAAVVSAHIAMCPACTHALADLELMGAALLLAGPGRPAARSRRREAGPVPEKPPARLVNGSRPGERLPAPIAAAYGLSFDEVPWKRLGPGVWHHRLALSDDSLGDLRLLRIAPGRAMPEHGHGGAELTLVLDGAYKDATGVYRRGDLQDVDESVEHTPVSDAELGCVCLIASEQPARFKGVIGRLLQPWTGM